MMQTDAPTRWSPIIWDDSVFIIDISNPDQPDLVSREFDKEDGFALDTPIAVDMALIGESSTSWSGPVEPTPTEPSSTLDSS